MPTPSLSPPDVIFLDAVGTLFGVQGSVGDIYSSIAQEFGVVVAPATLDQAFRTSFAASVPPAFPGVAPADIPQREFQWWRTIAAQTFTQAGVFSQFADFDAFFTTVYDYFATAAAWVVYADVPPMLEYWRSLGIQLGILSNFDSRLYATLSALELAEYFTTVTISTIAGAAKPDSAIFQTALQHAGFPRNAWHIGDSYREDYQGAIAAGLRGIWLCRSDMSVPTRATPSETHSTDRIHSLQDLMVS